MVFIGIRCFRGDDTEVIPRLGHLRIGFQGRLEILLCFLLLLLKCLFGAILRRPLPLLAPPLSGFALMFGPPEYFALIILGIILLTYLTQKSIAKSLTVAAFGFLLTCIGMDETTGTTRYCFGFPVLWSGLSILLLRWGSLVWERCFRVLLAERKERYSRPNSEVCSPTDKTGKIHVALGLGCILLII
jgi:putative tricarboxylic transport membrane protein